MEKFFIFIAFNPLHVKQVLVLKLGKSLESLRADLKKLSY